MGYSIKVHEVDALLNVVIMLGWELKEESSDNGGITVKLYKKISNELLAASGELEKTFSPE